MAIGTGLAIGIAAAASAGSQIYAAKTASKAAKDAAKIQTQGADRAMGAVDSALGPWVRKGRETASTLGRLTAAPPGSRFAAPDPTMAPPAQGPSTGARPMPQGGTIRGLAQPRGGPMNTWSPGGNSPPQRQPPQLPPGMPGVPSLPPSGGGAEMIMLRAPDGSTQPVPAYLADRYIQAGAERIG